MGAWLKRWGVVSVVFVLLAGLLAIDTLRLADLETRLSSVVADTSGESDTDILQTNAIDSHSDLLDELGTKVDNLCQQSRAYC